MSRRRSWSRRSLRIAIRRGVVRIADTWGPIAEASAVMVAGIVGLGAMAVLGHILGYRPAAADLASILAAGLVPILVTSVTVYVVRKAARHHRILIEVTMSYLIHGGRSLLDELLGRMIVGRWERESLKPGDALFDVLAEVCRQRDWPLKRRVAEALPVLGEIDPKRSLEIAGILREDWHEAKWKGDLRRRAVEALVIVPPTDGIPLLHHVKPNAIEPLLKFRSTDEVFTAIAILEVLHEWEIFEPMRAARLQREMLEFVDTSLPTEEREALHHIADFLRDSKNRPVEDVAQKLQGMGKSPNVYVRIAAARNIWLLFDKYPQKAFELMEGFSETTEHENVRRPIAKERSVRFLIGAIKGPLRDRAVSLLYKLLADPDDIIREGTFDMAESLEDADPELLREVCASILKNETIQDLRERAGRIMHRASDARQ